MTVMLILFYFCSFYCSSQVWVCKDFVSAWELPLRFFSCTYENLHLQVKRCGIPKEHAPTSVYREISHYLLTFAMHAMCETKSSIDKEKITNLYGILRIGLGCFCPTRVRFKVTNLDSTRSRTDDRTGWHSLQLHVLEESFTLYLGVWKIGSFTALMVFLGIAKLGI